MNKYKIVKTIGKGTFGTAYLVESLTEHKKYVIKKINMSQMNAKEKKEALNEVNIIKSLDHPHIVKYHDNFVDEGKLCIVMEYAEGGDM
jgi:NIMA (never in mitosis gene a)-related kinase 1/4/5